jgi:hypothetical protein
VVSARGDCHQVVRESLDAVWADGVGTNHHAQVVSLEERVQVVWAEIYDVVLFLWISHVVVLEAVLFLGLVRVTPKKIQNLLVVLRVISSKLDLKWSLNLLDTLNILNSWTNSSMAAENSLLFISNNSCKWHLLKSLIDFCKDTIWVVDIFSESLGALVTES